MKMLKAESTVKDFDEIEKSSFLFFPMIPKGSFNGYIIIINNHPNIYLQKLNNSILLVISLKVKFIRAVETTVQTVVI